MLKTKKDTLDQIILEGQKKRPELETASIDHFFRMISKYFSWVFIKLKFTPNMITILAIIASIIGGFYLAQGNANGLLIAALFFFLFLLFDYCDGEVARVLNKYSMAGHYLDYMAHFIMFSSLMIGLTYSVYNYHSNKIYLLLGLCGLAGILLKSIATLLISEVIITEHLRVMKKLSTSNVDINYYAKSNIESISGWKDHKPSYIKYFHLLIRPSTGDDLLFFFVPFSIIIYFFPTIIIKDMAIRLIDIYFVYICLTNIVLSLLLIFRTVREKRVEASYNTVFGD